MWCTVLFRIFGMAYHVDRLPCGYQFCQAVEIPSLSPPVPEPTKEGLHRSDRGTGVTKLELNNIRL
jgi:hypothetical protein